jgi:hypothetical protein
MNVDDLLSDGTTGTDIGNQLTSSITDMLGPVIWLSVALTIVFIVLYISAMIRRRKVENAVLDMQKILHEMNERDKARSQPPALALPPKTNSDRIIAAEQPKDPS